MTQGATRLDEAAGARVEFAPVASHSEAQLPRLPAAAGAGDKDWEERAHRFHRFGPATKPEAGATGGVPFDWEASVPAALLPIRDARPGMPAVLIPGTKGGATEVRGLDELLERSLQALRASGIPARVLGEIMPRLLRRISRKTRDEVLPLSFREIAGEEAEALLSDLCLSGESGRTLAEEVEQLLALFHLSWRIFGPSVDCRQLAVEIVRRSREPARHQLMEEARLLSEQVDDLLRIDYAKGSSKGLDKGLESGLGDIGLRHIDHESLAKLHPDRRAARLEEGRRKRLEHVSTVLGRWLADDAQSPLHVHVFGEAQSLSGLEGVEATGVALAKHERPLRAATEFFPEAAAPVIELAKALRIARLELGGAYRPEVHDAAIATLDWQALKHEEMALIPPVLAVSDSHGLLERDMGDLCSLVWSGRPVIVISRTAAPDPIELLDLSRHQPSLGAMMVALRHAWVMQSSASRPAHLAGGLLECDPRFPSVALVASAPNALLGEAAVAGRAFPVFVFRPGERGGEIDLFGNPSPKEDWPTYSLAMMGQKSVEQLATTLTFAEAAFFVAEGRDHLFPIPVQAWSEGQVTLPVWISHPGRDKAGGPLPYIWLVGSDGFLWRAVVSRALALACADRLRDYQLLQEMAGLGGVHLARAREEARAEVLAETEAERERLIVENREAVEGAAREAARSAMAGLAAALLAEGPMGAMLQPVGSGPVASPRSESAIPVPVATEPQPVEEEETLLQDPWIDTPLCTSCNDCFKINDRLFKYDDNKQALFTDLSLGTYAELVRAAEACPAKCIHPGRPRPDDPTATPDIIQRGAKL